MATNSNNQKLPLYETNDSKEKLQHASTMSKQGVYAAVSYMLCAVLLIMFNKAALSSYKFPYVNVITLCQSFMYLYLQGLHNPTEFGAILSLWSVIDGFCWLNYMVSIGHTHTIVNSSFMWWRNSINEVIPSLLPLTRCPVLGLKSGSLGALLLRVSEPHGKETNSMILVPLRTVLHTLPLAFSYLLYLLVSMESVRGINVPMYTTLRRTTVAFTMLFEYILAGQKHSFSVVGSVGIIIFGAIVAGARDLAFDSYSYAVVFTANICTAIYLASIARVGKSSGLNSFGLMWCNGLICTPFLLIWTYIRGDLEMTLQFPHLYSPGFQAVMVLSCLMAFLLNYTVFLNTTRNSALTQTICGNLKDLFTIGIGWLLFGGLPFDLMNVVGQSLGFLGSCLYAYCKLKGK